MLPLDVPMLSTQPKLTLATNDDDDDGSDEEFPKAVINRLVGLKQIQVFTL